MFEYISSFVSIILKLQLPKMYCEGFYKNTDVS